MINKSQLRGVDYLLNCQFQKVSVKIVLIARVLSVVRLDCFLRLLQIHFVVLQKRRNEVLRCGQSAVTGVLSLRTLTP